jgi:hypothetical protein
MKRRELIAVLGSCLVWPFAARGQQAGRMFRVGWASPTDSATVRTFLEAFVSALHERGNDEGQNIVYEVRYAENDSLVCHS